MRSVQIPYFRIWYSSLFVFLSLAAFVLTTITPADIAYQSIRSTTIPNIFSIGATYLLTILVCAFLWSSRLYTNRQILRDIPKNFLPIDDGEVPSKVYKIIRRQWERSALVAWDSRPRDTRKEVEAAMLFERRGQDSRAITIQHRLRKHRVRDQHAIIVPSQAANMWGDITHSGWSSPIDDETPDLQYSVVIKELPNLIEAKAVSLVPVWDDEQQMEELSGERVAALLQRQSSMGLREYVQRLAVLGVISPPELAGDFVTTYETARFSTRLLTRRDFRRLMTSFAAVLTSMTTLNINMAIEMLEEMGSNDGMDSSRVSTPDGASSRCGDDSSASSTHLQMPFQSLNRLRPCHMVNDEDATPRSASEHSLPNSFTRTRTNLGMASKSATSLSLHSTHSVIRLAPESSRLAGDLPYQIDAHG